MPRVRTASISSLGAPKLRYSDVLLDYSAFCAPSYLSVCLLRFTAFRKEVTPSVIPTNPAVKTVRAQPSAEGYYCLSGQSATCRTLLRTVTLHNALFRGHLSTVSLFVCPTYNSGHLCSSKQINGAVGLLIENTPVD